MSLRSPPVPVALISLSFLAGFSVAIAREDSPILQLVGHYSESFMTSGTRAGPLPSSDPTRVLVGLHLGLANGEFHIDRIGVLLSARTAARDFCVRVSSGDARYGSVNVYASGRSGTWYR